MTMKIVVVVIVFTIVDFNNNNSNNSLDFKSLIQIVSNDLNQASNISVLATLRNSASLHDRIHGGE